MAKLAVLMILLALLGSVACQNGNAPGSPKAAIPDPPPRQNPLGSNQPSAVAYPPSSTPPPPVHPPNPSPPISPASLSPSSSTPPTYPPPNPQPSPPTHPPSPSPLSPIPPTYPPNVSPSPTTSPTPSVNPPVYTSPSPTNNTPSTSPSPMPPSQSPSASPSTPIYPSPSPSPTNNAPATSPSPMPPSQPPSASPPTPVYPSPSPSPSPTNNASSTSPSPMPPSQPPSASPPTPVYPSPSPSPTNNAPSTSPSPMAPSQPPSASPPTPTNNAPSTSPSPIPPSQPPSASPPTPAYPSPSPSPSIPSPSTSPVPSPTPSLSSSISSLPSYPPSPSPSPSGLSVGYYRYSCPNAESIVREAVKSATDSNRGTGAGLIRLFFHDCFVEGCDASVLLNTTGSTQRTERASAPNLSLRGFEVIDAAKAALETACPGVVSCADIVAFAGRDATFFLSGNAVDFDMPAGRYDGRVSLDSAALANLPPLFASLQDLRDMFAGKGLDADDMVTLSGAHTVGRSHCSSFSDRLPPNASDMNATLAASLSEQCSGGGGGATVPQDLVTPDGLDSQYYRNVLNHEVLFGSDAALLASNQTADMVRENAFTPGLWEAKFKVAMVKMGRAGVKTSSDGEIRKKCWMVNQVSS